MSLVLVAMRLDAGMSLAELKMGAAIAVQIARAALVGQWEVDFLQLEWVAMDALQVQVRV